MALTNNLMQDEHGVFFPPRDPNEIKREEQAEAKRAEQEAAAAVRAAEIQATCDEIDTALAAYLRAELNAENTKARVSRAAKKDFEKFKTCCAKWGLPHLPAPPQAVAVFLTDKETNQAHVSRLAKHISLIHRAVGFADPVDDVLIRAILRQAQAEKKTPPQTKEN
jgi:hypothetical protein